MNNRRGYLAAFLALWFLCYLVYPFWLLPAPVPARAAFFGFLLVFFGLGAWGLNRLLAGRELEPPGRAMRILAGPFGGYWRENRFFLVCLLIFVLLHLFPNAVYPIRTCGDESTHASAGIQVIALLSPALESRLGLPLSWLVRMLTVLAGLLYLVRRRFSPGRFLFSARPSRLVWLAAAGLALLAAYFFLLGRLPFRPYLYKPTPLSRFLSLWIISLFGAREFWVRLPSLLFTGLAALVLQELVALYRPRDFAGRCASIFLFLPNVFHYAANAELAAGKLGLGLLFIFFLARHLRDDRFEDLLLAGFWAGAAFLWKSSMAVLQPVLWAVLIWDGLERKRPGPVWRGRLAVCLLAALPVLLSLGLEMGLVHYEIFTIVSGRKAFHLADFMTYFTRLPEQVTWFGFILFCGGLASIPGRPRDWLLRLLSIYLLAWYLALSFSLAGLGLVHNRWQLPAYPAVAFFIAVCLDGFRRRAGATILLLLFLASCATWLPFPGVVPEYLTYHPDYLSRLAGPDAVLTERPGFLPYPEALRHIRYRLPAGRRILAVDFPDPREFYAYRYGAQVDWFLLDYRVAETWRPRSEQTPAALGEFCRANRIEYLLLPDGRWLPYLDRGLADRLLMDLTDSFELVRKFELYGNEVYLWKTKKTIDRRD